MSRLDWIAAIVKRKGGSVDTAVTAYKSGATAHRAIMQGLRNG